jgi:hypothetical protein
MHPTADTAALIFGNLWGRRVMPGVRTQNMDLQIWHNLILLVTGGVLTALGAWINDLRSEGRRKRVKLEEAYLTWLNTESSILGRLKELTKLAEDESKSVQAYELLLEKFERLHSDLQTLTSALNQALIYERDRNKKALVETQSLLYANLTESLSIIVRHHRTHLEFHATIDQAKTLVSRTQELMESDTGNSDSDIARMISKLHQEAHMARDEASDHLSKCSMQLCTDVKEVSEHIKEIEKKSPAFRRSLIE